MLNLFFIILILFFKNTVQAQTTNLFINEVLIEPEQKIELINLGAEKIDLNSWFIDDDGGTTYYQFTQKYEVQPNSCVVISSNFNLNKTTPDTVRLFDPLNVPTNGSSLPRDFFKYSKSPGENLSFQKVPDGTGTWVTKTPTFGLLNESLSPCEIIPTIAPPTATKSIASTFTVTPSQTPTATPKITETTITYEGLIISEFMPNPESFETEWIELYNNSKNTINLSKLYIDDSLNAGSPKKQISGEVSPFSYTVIFLSTAMLNNSNDEIFLYETESKIIDKAFYNHTKKGLSWGIKSINEKNFCLQNPSAYEVNSLCIEEIKNTPTIGITTQPSITLSNTVSSYVVTKTIPHFKKFIEDKTLSNSKAVRTDKRVNYVSENLTLNLNLIAFYFVNFFLISLFCILSVGVKMKNGS